MASDRCAVRRCGHSMRWSRSDGVLHCDVSLILSPAAVVAARKYSAMPFPERATGLRGSRGASGCGHEIPAVDRSSRTRRRRSASRVPPVGSWGARREERQVDRVVNVVHAIRGTLREAGADRPDDDEAVLVTEVRIEQDRGGYPTAGGLLAVGIGAPDGRRAGHDASRGVGGRRAGWWPLTARDAFIWRASGCAS